LVITKDIGGTLNEADIVDDYPGLENLKGPELGKLFKNMQKIWCKNFIRKCC
jgi:hypothetical protein